MLNAKFYHRYSDYFEDDEEIDVKAGGGQMMTMGNMVRQWLTKLDWFSTLFPRIPVPIQKQIEQKLMEYDREHNTGANYVDQGPADYSEQGAATSSRRENWDRDRPPPKEYYKERGADEYQRGGREREDYERDRHEREDFDRRRYKEEEERRSFREEDEGRGHRDDDFHTERRSHKKSKKKSRSRSHEKHKKEKRRGEDHEGSHSRKKHRDHSRSRSRERSHKDRDRKKY